MRITNNLIQANALANLQTNLRRVSEAQQQVSTGLRIQKASDDPSGASRAIQTRGSIRALDQYQRNIAMANSAAASEETSLGQLGDILMRAKELAMSQGSGTSDATTRATTKVEVDQLLQAAIQLGNTKTGDEYLFGGQWADQAPFDAAQTGQSPPYVSLDPATGLPREPSGVNQTEISAGRYMQATHDGKQVLLDSGVLAALKSLSDALGATDSPQTKVQTSLGDLDTAFDNIQVLLGENGARVNQLDVTSANISAFAINLKTLKSDVEEDDVEKAVTELVSRQTAFQAAMLATSKVMGLTLADYLR
jgi:flagellar hook-associated protein 3 FlgL